MYHGVCDDHLENEPWMPAHFTTRSAFESQLQYLKRHAVTLPLSEAIARMKANDLPERCVSVTFDDGYANNLHLAYPLLEKHRVPATIFVASGYVESEDLFPFDRLRLISFFHSQELAAKPTWRDALLPYRHHPLDTVLERAEKWWGRSRGLLSAAQNETLRPLRVEELRSLDPHLIELGSHGHTHCIFRNETAPRRRNEITRSVQALRKWTGRAVTLFSYPNGERDDFNEADKSVLRSEGIAAAVTTMPGANPLRCDPLELRRYPVGLFHDSSAFAAEVTGLRSVLKGLFANGADRHICH
jgi:peptidoglycan/xylan/chitin deacetylase (PgdA/CDA1 family)